MQIVILGSAATRDALDLLDESELDLRRYFARSTLASAMGTVRFAGVETKRIVDTFRRALVEADLSGTFVEVLDDADFDLLIYDPVDERFDMLERQDGALATMSREFAEAGYRVDDERTVRSGSPEAFELWRSGWDALITKLRSAGTLSRLRVNEVYWATTMADGSPLPEAFPPHVTAAANAYLARLYAVVRETIPERQIFGYQPEQLVAAADHRWGMGPVHFDERYYRRCAEFLREAASDVHAEWAREWEPALGAVADRQVASSCFVDLRTKTPRRVGSGQQVGARPRGRGELSWPGACTRSTFRGGAGSYEVAVDLPEPIGEGVGAAARFRLQGWEEVRYVAIGWTAPDRSFLHLKANNPRMDAWETVCWSLEDLSYLIHHGFEHRSPVPIADVRVWVAGTPGATGASIDLEWVGAWSGESDATIEITADQATQDRWIANVVQYVSDANSFADTQALRHLETGDYPVIEDQLLSWTPGAPVPDGLEATTTFEHRFHGHMPTAALLIHAARHGSTEALDAAASWIESWLDHHAGTTTPTLRYTWYDHATAERLIAFDLFYAIGTRQGADPVLLERVRRSIEDHARLLESLVFYARHQRHRYHNHAWFQDLALLVTSELFEGPATDRWRATAGERFGDQLDHLLTVEGDYTVSVENSVGYHSSMAPLLGRFAALLPSALVETLGLEQMQRGIQAFTDLLRYPDGRLPAQGDTFRRRSGPVASRPAKEAVRGLTVLERSGYAVAQSGGGIDGFHLAVYATSLSDTHKHADNLSFTLFHRGVEWFCDPSFYSHEYAEPHTAYLRGPWAHSQLVVDGARYETTPGLARISGTDEGAGFRIAGSHRAHPGITVYRTVRGSWDNLELHGEDRATVAPTAQVALVFHLGEDVTARLVEGAAVLEHPGTSAAVELAVSAGLPEVVSGWNEEPARASVIATTYQTCVDSVSLVYRTSGAVPIAWTVRELRAG